MQSKLAERERAIVLRREGLTYGQILAQVSVAKSTLSLWLRSVSLSKRQRQRLTAKRLEAGLRGGASKRLKRIEDTKIIVAEAIRQIGSLSKRELLIIGVALYWAEGSKEKEGYFGSGVIFSNSDAQMARFFKEWLLKIIGIQLSQLKFELYIHQTHFDRLSEIKHYWAKALSIPPNYLYSVYLKRNNKKTIRKRTGKEYYGQVRIRVRASSSLNRRIAGWVQGIVENCGFV